MPLPRRIETIQAHTAAGGAVAAVLPIHYPRGLFRAFGFLPVEVWGPPYKQNRVEACHLQSYVCSIVQRALAFLQSGGLDIVDVIVVPHTCDALQGLGSILLDFIDPDQYVLPIYLPRRRHESDIEFLAAEINSIYQHLEDITHLSPTETELMQCIEREEEADSRLAHLHQIRPFIELSSYSFYRIVRTREYLAAETFMNIADKVIAQDSQPRSINGTPIILSGIVPEPMSLLSAIDNLGGRIVADDLACCGRRLYPRGHRQDPFERMAERLLGAPPDVTRGSPIHKRIETLLDLTKISAARGIVFYTIKFCEPEFFDLPIVTQELRQAGIPSLVIEAEISDVLSQQTLTRLSAFFEMLQ